MKLFRILSLLFLALLAFGILAACSDSNDTSGRKKLRAVQKKQTGQKKYLQNQVRQSKLVFLHH
ncbi:hypothetical protein CV093_04185 [Oceanobacillus sp. 143]|nr:hypothetical protein CV093_04185 [Oceanobacillus sp. 143]